MSVQIDGIFLLTLSAAAAALFIYSNRNRFNPASHDNYIYQAVEGETLNTVGDYVFGAVDLINPFNESDEHALRVYGLADDL